MVNTLCNVAPWCRHSDRTSRFRQFKRENHSVPRQSQTACRPGNFEFSAAEAQKQLVYRSLSLLLTPGIFTPLLNAPLGSRCRTKINALALGLILAMYNEQLSDHSNQRIGARLRPADKEEGATMTKIIFSIVGVLLTACLDIAAVHASMQEDVDQAVTIIQRFQEIPDRA